MLAADAKKQLATNKRRGQSLLALIERCKNRITEEFYDIGEALRELVNNKPYAAVGFDTFEPLLDERKVMSRAQAAKLIRLVDGIPRRRSPAPRPGEVLRACYQDLFG